MATEITMPQNNQVIGQKIILNNVVVRAARILAHMQLLCITAVHTVTGTCLLQRQREILTYIFLTTA